MDMTGGTTGRVARRGLWGIARIVRLITTVVVGLIVVGILLVVFEANRGNNLVDAVLDGAKFLVGPLDNVFKVHRHKANVAVNWGVAAAVYAFIGAIIARLLRR
jgi:hypothetical protein